MNKSVGAALAVTGLLIGGARIQGEEPPSGRSDLADYVRRPDPTYRWKVLRKVEGNPATVFTIRLASQSWRGQREVDRTVWEHWLTVVAPRNPVARKAFLMVGGGSNDSDPPQKPDEALLRIAEATQSVVAELQMVPNQPLVFHDDGTPRQEDDLIAYAWDQYLKTGDADWLPRLPMVKSVVRAMDCVQELLAEEPNGALAIEQFVVAGGSKRGWTTWMTAVADPRVEAIVPIVIDVLNMHTSLAHHAAVYGFWSEAIGDYFEHGIMQRWDHPRMKEIHQIVDPFFHRDRLTLPKYIVNASGDQFFCPDSCRFYFHQLQGEKHLRYVPNADHSLSDTDALETIIAFYRLVLAGQPRPRYDWAFESDGSIRVRAEDRPAHVLVWQATNPRARDFRLQTLGPAFTSRELSEETDGVYVARVAPPTEGWTAFFVELTYDTAQPLPLKFTSGVRVTPDTLPFEGIDLKTTPYEPLVKRKTTLQ